MTRGAIYLVSGSRRFRGHEPGSTFEAVLEEPAERRALSRGDIEVVERITPSLQPGSYSLPDGWVNQKQEVQ